MKNFNFPTKKNEIIEFVKNNFNRDDLSIINNDEAFENMHIRFRTRPNNERWIGYCYCVVKEMDGYDRPWVINFLDKYSTNMSVMMIIWALSNGVTCEELIEIVGY